MGQGTFRLNDRKKNDHKINDHQKKDSEQQLTSEQNRLEHDIERTRGQLDTLLFELDRRRHVVADVGATMTKAIPKLAIGAAVVGAVGIPAFLFARVRRQRFQQYAEDHRYFAPQPSMGFQLFKTLVGVFAATVAREVVKRYGPAIFNRATMPPERIEVKHRPDTHG